MNLLSSLGMDSVDMPGTLPPGRYPATVFKSEYVTHRAKGAGSDAPKDHISHVVTYRVTEGDKKGAEKAEWFPVVRVLEWNEAGNAPAVDAEGKPKVVPTMQESQKPWYKKRLTDLGVPEAAIGTTFKPEDLVGKDIVLGIKHKDGYENISFIELRQSAAAAAPSNESIIGSL